METEPLIIKEFVQSGKVRLVYRHLVQISDISQFTGEASECAADQGKFWEMRDKLYRQQRDVYGGEPRSVMLDFARNLGLDEASFTSCLDSGKHRQFVIDDYTAAEAEGIRSRPEFRLAKQLLIGAQPYEVFKEQIEQLISK